MFFFLFALQDVKNGNFTFDRTDASAAVLPQPHCLRKARERNQKRRQPDISSQSSSSQGINGPSYQGLSPICLFLVWLGVWLL